MHLSKMIESLSNKRMKQGEVAFATSAVPDKHIQSVIDAVASTYAALPPDTIVTDGDDQIETILGAIATQSNAQRFSDRAQVQQKLENNVKRDLDAFTKSPLLYDTIKKNIVESKAFDMIWKLPRRPMGVSGDEFNRQTFFKLVRYIAAENDEFWPLRGFVDRRPLSAAYEFVTNDPKDPNARITTAAASPSGTFYFNEKFMQALLDYAELKQIKPKGAKYEANGGPFPNGYAYIEFLIMHEFMHYSNDDFYYQKIIPNANPTIINWVGDFRSNYLLVKSGHEQLPMGLYNDAINYDRQQEYIQMYKMVEEEFKRLNPEDQKRASKKMDQLSDNHEPGQEDGEKSDQKIPSDAGDRIDQNGKRVEEEVEKGSERAEAGTEGPSKPESERTGDGDGDSKSGPGTGKGSRQGINWDNIRPQYNWTALLKKFITSKMPKAEETYARPSRRGITGIEVARQTGAGAMKPGDRPLDHVDLKLALVLDTSGSMSPSIAKVFANVNALLKMPMYKKSTVIVVQFSGSHVIWQCNFASNMAIQVAPNKGAKSTPKDVFAGAEMGGTVVSPALTSDMAELLKQGYNVLMVTDSDIVGGNNQKNTMSLIKAYSRNMFILFNSRNDYVSWRQTTGVATPNISHM
jgi:predicted metal-dependent peptidase